MRMSVLVAGATLLVAAPALALPDPAALADAAARRFPQPIPAGKLVGRRVLAPEESQPTLGWVRQVVRQGNGQVAVVMSTGGWLGLFTHTVAVPVDATALLGQYLEVVGFAPDEVRGLAPFDAAGSTPVPAGETVRVGLARPSH